MNEMILAQLCKPVGRFQIAKDTSGNWERSGSRLEAILRWSCGRQVEGKGRTIGIQLGNNWVTSGRQLKRRGTLEATGRQHLGNHIWETGNWEWWRQHLVPRPAGTLRIHERRRNATPRASKDWNPTASCCWEWNNVTWPEWVEAITF